jgi:DNA-binding ferritin-like protein
MFSSRWELAAVRVAGTRVPAGLVRVISALRAASDTYRDAHWKTRGYGNHLLFQRLYGESDTAVDGVAEMLVGTYGPSGQPWLLVQDASTIQRISGAEDPYSRAIAVAREVLEALSRAPKPSSGWDDVIMRNSATFETHLYLLQQGSTP